MKKYILLVVFGIWSNLVFGQAGAVNKATTLLQKSNFAGAKEQIDLAIEHEKTKDKAKTWYTKGQVYEGILLSDKPELAPNAFEETIEAYNKTKALEGKETAVYYLLADQRLEALWGNYLNNGANSFQEADYAEAAKQFELAAKFKPKDTTAYLYAGIAFQQNDQHQNALTNYYKLLELGYKSVDIYGSIIYLEISKNEDPKKGFEVLQMARKDFPKDKELMKQEISMLINDKKTDEAKAKLEEAIAAEPNNANLHYNMAFLLDELKDKEGARKSYKKAIEIQPDYFDANFNIGVSYYNEAAELLGQANNMDLKTYQKSGKQIEDKAKNYFKEALPYWEAALRSENENLIVIETLQVIYSRLNMLEKAEEMMQRATAITGGN